MSDQFNKQIKLVEFETVPLNSAQKINDPSFIEFTENNSELTINGCAVVLSVQKSKDTSSTKQLQTGANDNINSEKKVFSLEEHSDYLKSLCQNLFVCNCKVNMHALKSIIKAVSQNLKNLIIADCYFYENDTLTLDPKSIKLDLNSKMLRELNFVFQIKLLQLPNICSIDIKLTKFKTSYSVEKNNQSSQSSRQEKQQSRNKDYLIKLYQCNSQSKFIDFELNVRNKLENKYKKNDYLKYVLSGKVEDNNVEEQVAENIIQDIKDAVQSYQKYIKNSFRNRCLIITENCLDNPVALHMIQNVIIKNKTNIFTVIFKECGTLSLENLSTVSDLLIDVKQLESLAFFESQPDFDCYVPLKEYYKLKNFKFIVLNRSSFDISEFQFQVFGEERMIDIDNKVIIQTAPTHYGFFILGKQGVQEFTPYEYLAKSILFPNQTFLNEELYQKELLRYQIGSLIQQQKGYEDDVKDEIKKYEDDIILTFQGITEQIMLKYTNILGSGVNHDTLDELVWKEQSEFEVEVLKLISYYNHYSNLTIFKLLEVVSDEELQMQLRKKMKYSPQSIDFSNPIEQFNVFLLEQGFTLNTNTGYLAGNTYYSKYYTFKEKKALPGQGEGSSHRKLGDSDSLDKLLDFFEKESDFFQELQFTLFEKSINFKVLIYRDQLLIDKEFSFKISQSSEDFYESSSFQKLISTILNNCQKIGNLTLIQMIENKSFLLILLDQLFKSKCHVKHLLLASSEFKEEDLWKLYLPENIKSFSFGTQSPIEKWFFKIDHPQKEFSFFGCVFQEFVLSSFKNLQKLSFSECYNFPIEILQDQLSQDLQTKEILLIDLNLGDQNEMALEQLTMILSNQSRAKYKIVEFNEKQKRYIQGYLKEQSSILNSINLNMVSKFYGENIELQTIYKNQKIDEDLNNINSGKKNQKINIDGGKFNRWASQRIIGEFEDIINIYQNTSYRKEKLKKLFESNDQKVSDQFFESLSYCCKKVLVKENFNVDKETLSDFILKHNGEFCLFKSSLIQNRFQPKEIQINFCKNIMFDEFMIRDGKQLDSIEKLDVSNSVFFNILQVKMIDILIQHSPQLSFLKFNNISIMENVQAEYTPIKNKNLVRLNISNNNYEAVLPLLTALNNIITLKHIDIENTDLKDQCGVLLKNNQISLKELRINNYQVESYEIIKSCKNLEKISLFLLYNESFSISLEAFQNLKEFNLYPFYNTLNSQTLTHFFNITNGFSNLINIGILQQNEKHHSNQSFYRELSKKGLFQIIKINKNISVREQEEKKLQSIEKYIRKNNFLKSIKVLDSLNKEIKSNLNSFRLIELHLSSRTPKDYVFLNKIFEMTMSSLVQLSLTDSDLRNDSFQKVDFRKLPKTVRRINLNNNKFLRSLEFLDPVWKNLSKYQLQTLYIYNTDIDEISIIKWKLSIKNVCYSESTNFKLDQLFEIFDSKEKILNAYSIIGKIQRNSSSPEDQMMLYQFIVQDKLFGSNHIEQINQDHLILSPLSMVASQIHLSSYLIELYDQQLTDSRVSLNDLDGNKYLWWCGIFLNQRYQYVFGYSRKYHGLYFYYLKNILLIRNQNDFSKAEHIFCDYLLLLKMQERQNNVKQMHLYINLEISDDLMNRQNTKSILEQRQKELKDQLLKIQTDQQNAYKQVESNSKIVKKLKIDKQKKSIEKPKENQILPQTQTQNIKLEGQTIPEQIKQLKVLVSKGQREAKELNQKKLKLEYQQVTLDKQINNSLNYTKIDEYKMIEYLNRIPPSKIIVSNRSVQFLKAWYVISTLSPLAGDTTIQLHQPNQIYNSSIGNHLARGLSKSSFFYSILHTVPQKYRYDDSIYLLAQNLQKQIKQNQHVFLSLLFPLYLFVCTFSVFFFSIDSDVRCGKGISIYSYCCYLGYGLLSLFIEFFMFKHCLQYVSHLVPSLEINLNSGCISKITNNIKLLIIDTPWINQWFIGNLIQFSSSQFARFELFTNQAFLYSTYACGDYTIFYIAIAFISLPILHSLLQLYQILFDSDRKYPLPTSSLDVYYKISNITEFKAVSAVIDLVSPSNATVINGRMFNSEVVTSFIKILGKNIPLVIIQIYNLSQQTMTSSLVISLITSILTLLSLLYSFITLTPSTLNQVDFNKLQEKKIRDQVVQKYDQRLQTFEDETLVLRFFDHLKSLRLEYLREENQSNLVNLKLSNKYHSNLIYYQKLFDSPKEALSGREEGEEKQKLEQFN